MLQNEEFMKMNHFTEKFKNFIWSLLAVLIFISAVSAQAIKQGTLLREKVHGVSLQQDVANYFQQCIFHILGQSRRS